jgi:hypothetical protein
MKIQKIQFSSENKLSKIQTEENENLVGLKKLCPCNLSYQFTLQFTLTFQK